MHIKFKLSLLVIALLTFAARTTIPVMAQVPTGTIAGTVTDPSGAVIQKATVTVTNKDTGASRVIQTSETGTFSAPSLPPGAYEVRVEASGFAASVRSAEVLTGTTANLNVAMQVGAAKEVVDVQSEGPTLNLESNTVQGVVTRTQIENLPLNGRSAARSRRTRFSSLAISSTPTSSESI